MNKTFDELKKALSENPASFIVILGAGASIPAGLPSWAGLRDYLCEALDEVFGDSEELEAAKQDVVSAPNIWVQFSRLKKHLGEARYERTVRSALSTSNRSIPQIYSQLWRLGISGIIDFNLDQFAVNSYSKNHGQTADYATGIEPHKFCFFPNSTEKFVFHPHGVIGDSKSWVLTEKERRKLYNDKDFRNIITTLLNGKNLLIIGFNVAEWSFQELLGYCGINNRISGVHNYYFCPNISHEKQVCLENKGISVIPYNPASEMHEELNGYIDEILSFQSFDPVLPSVYKGKTYRKEDIPTGNLCYQCDIDELRNILNGVVSNIIPPGTVPTEEQLKELETFYNTYIPQLHRAWLVDPRLEETATIYGYKALCKIGSGAFGTVYEAEAKDGTRYALKILSQDVKDKITYLACFRRGIRSMKILTENGIKGMVQIHDSYEIPACLIMDLVEGVTLRDAIDQHLLTRLEIKLEILRRVAIIINSAHQLEERILHRDIKPENVMLENAYNAADFSDPSNIPEVKVLDFDLSWHRGAMEKTVLFGAVSQGFMAPEQNDSTVDRSLTRNAAVDTYSIGMLAYYVLTGRNPSSNQAQFSHFAEDLREEVKRAYHYNWNWACLPDYLAQTILNATRTDPRERLALNAFISCLTIAQDMYIRHQIPNTHPLVLTEIKDRLDPATKEQLFDFGRKLVLEYTDLSKRVTLSTTSEKTKIILIVEIQRLANEFDRRDGRTKYYKTMAEKAAGCVDSRKFLVSPEWSNQEAKVKISTVLPDVLDLSDIVSITDCIKNVRRFLDT